MRNFLRLPASLLLAAGLAAPAAHAQTTPSYAWKNVNIQGGGFVSGLVYSPAQAGLLYARTDVGGAYRWQPATRTWLPLTDYLSRDNGNYTGVRSIAPDPADPNRVYLAAGLYTQSWAGTAAILASNDQGATWTQSSLPIKLGGNEDGRGAGEPLQVDPNLGTTLYLGSSTDGLWRSQDRAATWSKVASFPVSTTAAGSNGISFVLFDKRSGAAGTATPTIYVGVLRTGSPNLYRSLDGGATWAAVPGAPTTLMPHTAVLAATGALYLTYGNAPGPNNVTAGDVQKYVPSTGTWASIKPALTAAQTQGGYAGLSLDPQKPGTLLVSTIDRWGPGDEVFRSTDDGATWKPLLTFFANNKATLDLSLSPSNASSNPHWLADVEIDPFNSDNAWFTTGYGVFSSQNLTATDQSTTTPTRWKFDNQGLEELVVRGLVCPPTGAPLLSAVGDLDGYRHASPAAVPASRFTPQYGTNTSLDFAEALPTFVARTHYNAAGKYGAYSTDGGLTFTAFGSAPAGAGGGGTVAVAADGSRLYWQPDAASGQATGVYYSTDHGTIWTAATGITPSGTAGSLRPVADRVNPLKCYVYDALNGRLLVSTNGGVSFAVGTSGLVPTPDYLLGDATLRAVFGREGDLWLTCPGNYPGDSRAACYHSASSGATLAAVASVKTAVAVGFGKPAAAAGYPAVYLAGTVGSTYGFYRSDDGGATWLRINDAPHQFGYVGPIVGDRQTYGRVYVGTGGRGILYGDDQATLLATQSSSAGPSSRLTLYPNPNGGRAMQLSLAGYPAGTPVHLQVLSPAGQRVYAAEVALGASSWLALPSALRPGVYVVQATAQQATFTTRLVVE